jgi:hypothetical protein
MWISRTNETVAIPFLQRVPSCRLSPLFQQLGATMSVKIDGVEPNIFPDVEDLDARDAGRNVEVFFRR